MKTRLKHAVLENLFKSTKELKNEVLGTKRFLFT
jgi:hypothetical protein